MAKKLEEKQRVTVSATKEEISKLITDKAKEQGLIDFDPTRITMDEQNGGYILVFEMVKTDG